MSKLSHKSQRLLNKYVLLKHFTMNMVMNIFPLESQKIIKFQMNLRIRDEKISCMHSNILSFLSRFDLQIPYLNLIIIATMALLIWFSFVGYYRQDLIFAHNVPARSGF